MDNTQVKKSTAKKAGIGCLGIIVLFFALLPVIAAIDGWNRYKSGKESLKWPATQGVILSSTVKTDLGKSDDVDPRYTAAIAYRYTVEGYEYTGERVSFSGQTFLDKSKASSLARRYGKGLHVKVYFDPKTPHISVLEPGNASGPPIISFLLVAIVTFVLFRILRVFLRKKRTVPQDVLPSFTPQAPVTQTPYTPDMKPTGPSSGSSGKKIKPDKSTGILVLAFLAGGILIMGVGANDLRKGYESKNWPTAKGIIKDSYIDRQIEHKSDKSYITYKARIRFRYSVSGKPYYGREIGFGKSQYSSRKRSKTKKYLEQYPAGMTVTVHYDPDNPRRAVLNAGITGGALLIISIGILLFLSGVAFFIRWRNDR